MDFFPFEAPYIGLLVMFNVTHHPRTPLFFKNACELGAIAKYKTSQHGSLLTSCMI
jgi:hypothetical protein